MVLRIQSVLLASEINSVCQKRMRLHFTIKYWLEHNTPYCLAQKLPTVIPKSFTCSLTSWPLCRICLAKMLQLIIRTIICPYLQKSVVSHVSCFSILYMLFSTHYMMKNTWTIKHSAIECPQMKFGGRWVIVQKRLVIFNLAPSHRMPSFPSFWNVSLGKFLTCYSFPGQPQVILKGDKFI